MENLHYENFSLFWTRNNFLDEWNIQSDIKEAHIGFTKCFPIRYNEIQGESAEVEYFNTRKKH